MKNKFFSIFFLTVILGVFLASAASTGDLKLDKESVSLSQKPGDVVTTSLILKAQNPDIVRIPRIFYANFNDNLNSEDGKIASVSESIARVPSQTGFGNAVNITSTSKLAYPVKDNFNETAGTIEFWVKPEFDPSQKLPNSNFYQTRVFFEIEGDAGNITIRRDSINQLSFRNYRTSPAYITADIASGAYALDTTKWHYIAATWNKNSMALYLDGVKKADNHIAGIGVTFSQKNANFMIGSRYDGSENASSLIDDFRISSRQLSATEIKAIYDAKAPHTDADYADTYSKNITNITMSAGDFSASGKVLGATNITFTDNSFDILYGEQKTVNYKISIPSTQSPGTYSGTITATDQTGSHQANYIVSLAVSENRALTVSDTSLTLTTQPDTAKSKAFTLTNKGNIDLEKIKISSNQTDFTDKGSKTIDIKFSEFENIKLTPNQAKVITLTATLPKGLKIGKYTGPVSILDETTGVNATITFIVRVEPELCSSGEQGTLVSIVELKEPDESESFAPGEKISVEVEVRNDDDDKQDMTIEAFLYNIDDMDDDEDYLDTAKTTIEMKKESSKTLTLEMQMPYEELDEDDDYIVIVKSYFEDDEDKQCKQRSALIEADIPSKSVYLKNIALSGDKMECGATNYLSARVINNGEKDDKNVYIKIKNAILGIDESSAKKDIDSEDSGDFRIPFTLASTSKPGKHQIELIAYYDDAKKTTSEFKELEITCGTAAAAVSQGMDLSIGTASLSFSEGGDAALHILITNPTEQDIEASVNIDPVGDWFIPLASQPVSLISGNNNIYLRLVQKGNVSVSQQRSLTLSLKARGASTFTPVEKTLSVSVMPYAEKTSKLRESLDKLFTSSKQAGVFWIIVDVVLILFAVFLLKSIYTGVRRKPHPRMREQMEQFDREQKKLI